MSLQIQIKQSGQLKMDDTSETLKDKGTGFFLYTVIKKGKSKGRRTSGHLKHGFNGQQD